MLNTEDQAIVDNLSGQYELLCMWAANIAMLPLEKWRDDLSKAETLGAILDPTLFREYLYSQKPAVLKALIDAAIPLKHAVLEAQKAVKSAQANA